MFVESLHGGPLPKGLLVFKRAGKDVLGNIVKDEFGGRVRLLDSITA